MKPSYDKKYYKKSAKRNNFSLADYMKRARTMYIVLIDGEHPETWEEDGSPRLFTSFTEALSNCLERDTVISEYAFIKQFC